MSTYRHILLVDDDEYDQVFFQTVLRSITKTMKCTTLTDADIALNKLQAKEIRPDLIFIESDLPAMDCKEFLSYIKSENDLKDIPLIIFSAKADAKLIEETKALGAHRFIVKPNRYSELKTILSDVISSLVPEKGEGNASDVEADRRSADFRAGQQNY